MSDLKKAALRLWREEDGPTAVEYAVLVGIICGGALLALDDFGDRVLALYLAIDTALTFS